MVKSKSYQIELVEALRNPLEAAEYLNAALEEGDKNGFLLALRNVAQARGGIGKLSARTRLNRESLYRMLSARGNPELRSLGALLESLGLRLAIEVKPGRSRRLARTRPTPARPTRATKTSGGPSRTMDRM
ncbi:MAG: addiction module antidote protein [Thermoanaerobaculia bacterium]